MTHIDFNQLLSSLEALSPDQARQLRQQLDRRLPTPMTPAAKPSGKGAKPTKAASQPAKKPMTFRPCLATHVRRRSGRY
jgi:hypothetical protein